MFYSDVDLEKALEDKHLVVTPTDGSLRQPASIELRMGTSVRRWLDEPGVASNQMPRRLDRIDESMTRLENHLPQGAEVLVRPLEHLNIVSQEWVELDETIVGLVSGKSTYARAGIQVEAAGWVDPGFKGRLVFEIFNMAPFPIYLVVGQKIGQLAIADLVTSSLRPYGSGGLGSRYQGQHNATGPRAERPYSEVA